MDRKQSKKPEVFLRTCMWALFLQHTKHCLDWSLFYPFVCAPTLDHFLKWLRAKIQSGVTSLAYSDFDDVVVEPDEDDSKLSLRQLITTTFSSHARFSQPLKPIEVLAATLPPHGSKILPKHIRKPFRNIFDEDYYEYGVIDVSPNSLAIQVTKSLEIVDVQETTEKHITNLLYSKRLLLIDVNSNFSEIPRGLQKLSTSIGLILTNCQD